MYSEKQIEGKFYQLNPTLRKAGLVVKVFQSPTKIGYDIAIFQEEDKPAIKEIFLDHIIAEACFKKWLHTSEPPVGSGAGVGIQNYLRTLDSGSSPE